MLIVKCRWCDEELSTPGAILLSPPDPMDNVTKSHLCVECYQAMWMAAITVGEDW